MIAVELIRISAVQAVQVKSKIRCSYMWQYLSKVYVDDRNGETDRTAAKSISELEGKGNGFQFSSAKDEDCRGIGAHSPFSGIHSS